MAQRDRPLPHFPSGLWSGRRATFEPGADAPAGEEAKAVIVFARAPCGYILADIEGRGWTVPSGRLEAGETPEQAAVRETYEEIGATIAPPLRIGRYVIVKADGEILEFPTYVSPVDHFGAIPQGSESREARCFPLGDVPGVYWFWDGLLASVFQYADVCLDDLAVADADA